MTLHRMVAVTLLLLTSGFGAQAQGAAAPAAPVATPAAAPAASAPTAPASPAAPSVTGAAAWDRLKGNTITGLVGVQPFTEFFDAGGGVKYVDKDGISSGTWAVQGAKVCFDFPEDDDRSCSTFAVEGTTGSAMDDDSAVTKFTIEAGNSKGL